MSEIRKVDHVVDEIAVALRDNECRPSEERAFLLNGDRAIVAAIIQREYGLAEEKAREALGRISRHGPIMGSKGEYRQGQLDILETTKKIADEALAPLKEE